MNIEQYRSLNYLTEELKNYFPEHTKFINARFDNESHENMQIADSLSEKILKIADKEIDSYLSGYKWTCCAIFEEEIHFRRNNCQYRLSKFQDAVNEVYSNPEIMEPYMKGLLLSQVLWKNHTLVHQFFADFLKDYKQSGNYIEIGAGHGLFLANACTILPSSFDIQAWDISDSSLKETQNCLDRLDVRREIHLRKQDFNGPGEHDKKADLLVFSEILEHLENPIQVLHALRKLIKEDGFLFLNAPVNSPAPDHITNWKDPEEMISQVRDAGFDIKVQQVIPATGLTIDKAMKKKCVIGYRDRTKLMTLDNLVFDHIGIVVADLMDGEEVLRSLFPIKSRSVEYIDELINVRIRFLTDSSKIRYELITPLNDNSPLNSVLKTKKDVINHVAYRTETFIEAVAYYNEIGCYQLGFPLPAVAFNHKKVVFFLTKLGAIIELIEE